MQSSPLGGDGQSERYYISTIVLERLFLAKYDYFFGFGQEIPCLENLSTISVGNCELGFISGETLELVGIETSNRAPVGHEPIQERQPTQFFSTTITGRFPFSRVFSANGNNASNGQNGMHKSQPVQSSSVIATIACPIAWAKPVIVINSCSSQVIFIGGQLCAHFGLHG